MLAAGAGSSLLGQDANWDLQNYHYYNPWAWWNGRIFDWDVAAAQIQTFHNPLLDFPFLAMVSAAWPPRVIAFVLAMPAALAWFFVYKLAGILFASLPAPGRALAIACALAIGATSAMGVGALANTMNEWPLAALLVFALWWLVRAADAGESNERSALLVAGLAAGFATGAKLTAAPFPLAMCVALALRGPRLRVSEPAWFALGAACGFAVAYGAWGYALWTHFGNPVFPYANEWFRSPWWEAQAVAGRDFGPDTIAGFLAFPFAMWDPPMFLVAEVPYRDGRMALVWALALAAAIAWLWRRAGRKRYAQTSGAWRLVAWFYAASFAAWTIAFSIYRYLLPLDALAGLAIGGLLLALLPQRIAVAALVACTVALVATTRTADWGRVPFDERWFEAKSMPIVEPDGLVLITTGEAVSYYIPMLPASSRYVGVLNTLVKPDQVSGLAQKARELVRDHKGYVYQMTHPLTAGEEVLGPLGLERTSACAIVVTNMPVSPIEFCLLVRKEAAP